MEKLESYRVRLDFAKRDYSVPSKAYVVSESALQDTTELNGSDSEGPSRRLRHYPNHTHLSKYLFRYNTEYKIGPADIPY